MTLGGTSRRGRGRRAAKTPDIETSSSLKSTQKATTKAPPKRSANQSKKAKTPDPDPEPIEIPSSPVQAPVIKELRIGISFLVTVDGEHAHATAFDIDVNDPDRHTFNYLKHYVESRVKEYVESKVGILTAPRIWKGEYGAVRSRLRFDILVDGNNGYTDWPRFEDAMRTNGNKSASVVVEYGFRFAPGLAPPSADVKASRSSSKTPPIPKRPFNNIAI